MNLSLRNDDVVLGVGLGHHRVHQPLDLLAVCASGYRIWCLRNESIEEDSRAAPAACDLRFWVWRLCLGAYGFGCRVNGSVLENESERANFLQTDSKKGRNGGGVAFRAG